ncbi:MAG: hypothetical protein ACFB4J_00135 [Elainellaceae cyanobacterium]
MSSDPSPSGFSGADGDTLIPLILYACPTGPLAQQLEVYFERSRVRYGPNKAHAYMPHCTLTGFFHDGAVTISAYLRAIDAALNQLEPPPRPVARVSAMAFHADWHGLVVEAPWLKRLTAQFAELAPSPPNEALRLKDWLHVSLAYGFDPAQNNDLRELAQALVDPETPAGWELRFYQRQSAWICQQSWTLEDTFQQQ